MPTGRSATLKRKGSIMDTSPHTPLPIGVGFLIGLVEFALRGNNPKEDTWTAQVLQTMKELLEQPDAYSVPYGTTSQTVMVFSRKQIGDDVCLAYFARIKGKESSLADVAFVMNRDEKSLRAAYGDDAGVMKISAPMIGQVGAVGVFENTVHDFYFVLTA